ncbi:MAG: hypothetical protein ACE5KK_07590 [Candidatus Brocadiales bacterium]
MDLDIVKEISRIEKDAERIVEDARDRARDLEASVEGELAPQRVEHEKEFEAKAQVLKLRFKEEMQQEESKLEEAFEDDQSYILQRERERSDEVVSFLINRIREF